MQWTKYEEKLFARLNTPAKIQDFLNNLPFNFEKKNETIRSPREVLRTKTAHCLEGALLASTILTFHSYENYLLDLKARKKMGDMDHVVCVYKIGRYFGAISKTNHAVLRYREPVYLSIRELALSYFHEYFLNDGTKTLESYSKPLLLAKFNKKGWQTHTENLWYISEALDDSVHLPIVPKAYMKKLRKADRIEIEAGKLVEYKR